MSNLRVNIICKIHGEFEQIASSHLTGAGCNKCAILKNANNMKSNNDEFIRKAIEIHKNKYDYSKVKYINNRTKVIILCKEHGEFEQIPNSHLLGIGCKKCGIVKNANNTRSNNKEFIKKSIVTHGNKYDYSKVDYIKHDLKVNIICKIHGDFEQAPSKHLYGQGCPKCCISKQYSKSQISWLNFISKYNNINPLHKHFIILLKESYTMCMILDIIQVKG